MLLQANILNAQELINNLTTQGVQSILAIIVLAAFFVLGWIAAKIVNKIIHWLLHKSQADSFFESSGLKEAFGKISINWTISKLVEVYVILAFLGSGVQSIQVNYLANIVSEILTYIPLLVQGLLVLLIASIASKYIEKVLEHMHFVFVKQLTMVLTLLIFYLALVIALPLFLPNINVTSLLQLLQLFVAAIVVAVGLGFGLALGLGLKDPISKAGLKHQAMFDQLFEVKIRKK